MHPLFRTAFTALVALMIGGYSPLNSLPAFAVDSAPVKDWTLLVYLNGNNNLDSFGNINIEQMEKIGSTDRINVVVQWASIANNKVERLYIKKSKDPSQVTSPVVEDLGHVDMGDYRSVIDFVKWGAEHYPAQHYMVDIWDHGSGWHSFKPGEIVKDISWDDTTGNHITTKQLATALTESSKILGQKIDIYASDACLMAMAEIAEEVSDSVKVYGGSEETEPGAGWPYDTFLARWNALPATATGVDVGRVLSEEYAKSYANGSDKVTFSAFNLEALPALNSAISSFSDSFKSLNASDLKKVRLAVQNSTSFEVSDYVDFVDFITQLKAAKISSFRNSDFSNIDQSIADFIISSHAVGYPAAHGMSIWIPTDSDTYSQYADSYSQMIFDQQTHWGDVAKAIANTPDPSTLTMK